MFVSILNIKIVGYNRSVVETLFKGTSSMQCVIKFFTINSIHIL